MAQNVLLLIERRLEAAFGPKRLEVLDESHQHIGHAGSKPGISTHFRVKMTASEFSGLSRVQRHQKVYSQLGDLMNKPIHALALELKAPEEDEA